MEEIYCEDVLTEFPGARPLSKGGQRVVFAVNHPTFGPAVLKVGVFRSERELQRFFREVQVLQEIESEYYPHNYEHRILSGNRFLVLEERIEGQPLAMRLTGFSSVSSATALIEEVVAALTILWSKHVIHRDIKPDNIIISPQGHPRIIDLGIARLLDLESLTRTLAPFGPRTPRYAAPEQLENRKNLIDHRTDQFALGIVYAQLLLGGHHPFDPMIVGAGESIVENILADTWAREEFCDSRFDCMRPVLSKMLGHEQHQRYRRPEVLRSELLAILRSAGND